jgi:hypothetical protein
MFNPRTGMARVSLHNLAEPKPEVKDHAADQPETVRALTALHDAWARSVEPK